MIISTISQPGMQKSSQNTFKSNRKYLITPLSIVTKKRPKSFIHFSPNKPSKNTSIQLGSSLPKTCKNFSHTQKIIKPPTEIVPDTVIKESKKIDKQTALIHSAELNTTLEHSKKNISRLKEIYLPIRSFKQTLEEKHKPYKTNEFFSSHRNSIKEEIKFIFSSQTQETKISQGNQTEYESEKQTRSLLDYINKDRLFISPKNEKDLGKPLLITKFSNKVIHNQPKIKKRTGSVKDILHTISTPDEFPITVPQLFHIPSKISVKIKKKRKPPSLSIENSFSQIYKTLPYSETTASYYAILKGSKIKSKFGAMFTPNQSTTLTPNHFLNFD
jgi:hypothetical protein